MKSAGYLAGLVLIFFVSCNNTVGDSAKDKEKASYELTKKALLEKEQRNPSMFLTVKGNNKKNLIGQMVIKGKISSSASVATYKDVALKLDFFSKTKALLESDEETIFVEIKPGEGEDFKTKYFAPKGTDSVAISIKGAKVVQQ